jgi:VIT1/CCC1 family predicted Fe2+/Mn2+ transporter
MDPNPPTRGVLSPIDRLTELLCGLLLILTFTGTMRVAVTGQADLRTNLWAAVGSSLAWGLVDAVMYVFGQLESRNRNYQLLRALRADRTTALQQVGASIPSAVAQLLPSAAWDKLVENLSKLPVPPRARITRNDLLGAASIFVLANAALLPIAAPFVLIANTGVAKYVSDALALLWLFVCGFLLARYTGERPLRVAICFVGFGVALVAATIALGG